LTDFGFGIDGLRIGDWRLQSLNPQSVNQQSSIRQSPIANRQSKMTQCPYFQPASSTT
jgi:hypothetical protein